MGKFHLTYCLFSQKHYWITATTKKNEKRNTSIKYLRIKQWWTWRQPTEPPILQAYKIQKVDKLVYMRTCLYMNVFLFFPFFFVACGITVLRKQEFLKKDILYTVIKSKRILKVNSGKLVSLVSSGLQWHLCVYQYIVATRVSSTAHQAQRVSSLHIQVVLCSYICTS